MMHRPPDPPTPTRRAPGASSPDVVVGLWTGLLTSPSLRVGRLGAGESADPVGQPTAGPSHERPVRAPTSEYVHPTVGTADSRAPCRRACTDCGHSCGRNASGRPQVGTRRGIQRDPRHSPHVWTATGGEPAEHDEKAREGTQSMADSTVDLATVWDQIRERLATSLSPQQNALLNLTRPLGLVEDTAVLAAPNEFTQTVLESRMRMQLAEALSAEFGRAIRAAVHLEDPPVQPPAPPVAAPRRVEDEDRRWAAAERDRLTAVPSPPEWPADERLAQDRLAQDRIAHDRASEEL